MLKNKKYKKLMLFIKLFFTISILYYIIGKLDIQSLVISIKEINYYFLILAVLIGFINVMLSAYKWFIIQSKIFLLPISYFKSFKLYIIGNFFNLFLPGGFGGDGIKSYLVYKYTGSKSSIHSVIADRVIGLSILYLIGGITIIISGFFLEIPLEINLLFLSFMFFFIIFFISLHFGKIKLLSDLKEDLITILKSKKEFIIIILSSISFHLLVMLNHYIVSISLGFNISFIYFMMFIPIITIVSNIPISISGFGLREYTYITIFGIAGFTSSSIILIPLVTFFILIFIGFIGGLFYILERD